MLPSEVLKYLQFHRDEHLDGLMEFLRFASVANVEGPDEQCGPCAQWLVEYLCEGGFDARAESVTGKPNVLAEMRSTRGDRAATLLFYGHYDVQPGEPLDQWTTPAVSAAGSPRANLRARRQRRQGPDICVHRGGAGLEANRRAPGKPEISHRGFRRDRLAES